MLDKKLINLMVIRYVEMYNGPIMGNCIIIMFKESLTQFLIQ